ncbi:MAG: hypothetical protein M3209_09810 [Acidobacteriota bacterium]|nr:hypothetical protein [Acidobacteriota bacterium]
MSLIRRKTPQTLVAPCCAARMLDLHESTLLKGLAGTESLTQIRRGTGRRQRVSFILEEILELKAEWIEAARKTKSSLKLVN